MKAYQVMHKAWLSGFTLALGLTLTALLLPAETVLRLKIWAAQMWPWAQAISQSEEVAGLDKWVHAGLFGLLGLLGALAWRSGPYRPALLLSLLVLGAITEWLQQFVPGRSMSLGDWLADAAGALVGVGLVLMLATRRR